MPVREPLTPTQESDVLTFNPWGMDDTDYRELSDKFIVTRKPAECAICFERIPAGSRVRAKTEVFDGQCKTFRFCPECCWCIARRYDESDDDPHFGMERIEGRYTLGAKNAALSPTPASKPEQEEAMTTCGCSPYFFRVCDEHKGWPRCSRCSGAGNIPSETCDTCVDCTETCPACGGIGRVEHPAPTEDRER